MRLLLDQNLSRRLVTGLQDCYPGTVHVSAADMSMSSDAEIWEYAREHDLVITTKDGDFREFARRSDPPPKVIHLDVGNCSTDEALRLLVDNREEIEEFGAGEAGLLIIGRGH